jgi:hypothetical protein
MSIVLVGSTSGSITLQEPAVAGSTVLTLPAVTGNVLTDTSPKAGNVIQVVQTAFNTYLSVTSTTYTDTGITATITPTSSSSKILVMISAKLGLALASNASTGATGITNILRSATTIYESSRTPYGRFGTSAASNWRFDASQSFCVLDSPSTTSATTYKMQIKLDSTANGAEYLVNDYETASTSTNGCTITLMEIAA